MKNKKKLILFPLFLLTLLMTNILVVNAKIGVPYNTYTEDSNHRLIQTQDAYIPVALIEEFSGLPLNKPEDIFIDKQDNLYIADTGNKRILIVKQNGEDTTVSTIGEGTLNIPTGVFVTEDENIYVADYGNAVVYKFNSEGVLLQTFVKPVNNPIFGEASFKPSKVAVDARGNVYIVDIANYNGIIQMTQHGEFLSYYGTNNTKPTLRTIIQFMFSTNEQRKKLYKLPLSQANLALDNVGLINAISNDIKGNTIEKLDIAGNNLLPEFMFNDFSFLIKSSTSETTTLVDLYIGPIGNIIVINSQGFISEYDQEGNLLFVFGGKDTSGKYKGLLNNPSAIAIDSHYNIYAIDKADSKIHVYAQTDFASLVHEALYYYQEGKYIESKEPWEKVLQMNNMFDLAHKGLGKAYFKLQMYEEALNEFEIANDKVGYSESYWEIRKVWLDDNLIYIIVVLMVILFDYIFLRSFLMKNFKNFIKTPFKGLKKYKIVKEMGFIKHVMRNPSDGYYGIKREHKVSMLAATIFYVIYFIEHLFSIYYTGFIFNFNQVEEISIFQETINVFLPIFLFIISNYLVCSINDGEGKLSDVYKATIYSLFPVILFSPIVVILSNYLTLNESIIYSAGMNILWAMSILYLIIMIKELHNYTLKETFKIIVITIFTMMMIVASAFIFYILGNQLVNFILDIIMEVRSNV